MPGVNGKFPAFDKLSKAHVAFAQRHPELFPRGSTYGPGDLLGVFAALSAASRENEKDAYSFLLQAYLIYIGAPAPKGVFATQFDMNSRGRGNIPSGNRYIALGLNLLGWSTAKIAGEMFPDQAPDKGQPRVRSLVKSAEKDLRIELSRRNLTTHEERAIAATEILRSKVASERKSR
jgi:hypothetical protein